jgi:hypothetical protein
LPVPEGAQTTRFSLGPIHSGFLKAVLSILIVTRPGQVVRVHGCG